MQEPSNKIDIFSPKKIFTKPKIELNHEAESLIHALKLNNKEESLLTHVTVKRNKRCQTQLLIKTARGAI